jgi:peptidoglycan hydrolase CwlO-like protein
MTATLIDETEDLTEDDGEWTNCEHCLASVLIDDTDDDCLCPRCAAATLAYTEAEENYQNAVSEHEDAESEVDSLEEELKDLMEQVREKRAEIADAKARVKNTAKDLTKCGQLFEAAEAALEALQS